MSQHPDQPPGDCGYGSRPTVEPVRFGLGFWIAISISAAMGVLMALGAWFLFAHLLF